MTLSSEPKTSSEAQPRSIDAEASSAHARINIPLNLANWKALPRDVVDELTWFHQYILDQKLGWKEVEEAIGYDASTIHRILKGTYEGNWNNVVRKIRSYRKLADLRASVQTAHFRHNRITRRIYWILDYCLAKGGAVLIVGEAGMGKTLGTTRWGTENNHGRSVRIECLPVGGAKGLLRQIADKVGVNKNLNQPQMLEAVVRAFNPNRILLVDEVHQLLPTDRATKPGALELLRRISDLSGCALALIATHRFTEDIKRLHYQFEQLMGRVGKPFVLPTEFKPVDVQTIVEQFVPAPSETFIGGMVRFANDRELGRLRYVVELLRFASKLAHDAKKPLTEEFVYAAHNLREQNSKP